MNKIDIKVNTRITLAILWITHFILWTFGDMLTILQRMDEKAENSLILFVAVPLHIIEASMIYFSITGKAKVMRWANIIVTIPFILFNIGFLFEATTGWEYLLGTAGYLLFNILIIRTAWTWNPGNKD